MDAERRVSELDAEGRTAVLARLAHARSLIGDTDTSAGSAAGKRRTNSDRCGRVTTAMRGAGIRTSAAHRRCLIA